MYDMKLGPVITLDKKQYMLLSFWSHVSRLIYRAETIFSESHDVINQLHKPRFISGSSFNFTPYQEAEIVGDIEFSIKFSTQACTFASDIKRGGAEAFLRKCWCQGEKFMKKIKSFLQIPHKLPPPPFYMRSFKTNTSPGYHYKVKWQALFAAGINLEFSQAPTCGATKQSTGNSALIICAVKG